MKIILCGRAASGKDYFRDWLKNVEKLDVSYTTRPPRKGEIEGYTYNYISKRNFLELEKNDFFLDFKIALHLKGILIIEYIKQYASLYYKIMSFSFIFNFFNFIFAIYLKGTSIVEYIQQFAS